MRLSPLLHALSTALALAQHGLSKPYTRSEAVPPSQDPFYSVPRNISALKPGHVIRHRKPPASFEAFGHEPKNIHEAHQILYRTADNQDNATATVLTVLIPKDANMKKVVSYQVAEDAASVDCAPSFGFLSAVSAHEPLISATMQLQLLIVQAALARGWVVIVPDFQGPMGAYSANRLAGSAVLDGIRAALQSESLTGIDPNADIVLWGYSGGATVSQAATSMQPIYAPELDLAGAAVGGLGPSNVSLVNILDFNKNRRTGLLMAFLIGLSNQYKTFRAAIDEQLKPQHREEFYSPLHQCLETNYRVFNNKDVLSWFSDLSPVFNNSVLAQIGIDNTRGMTTSQTPMLWYQCTLDELADIKDIDRFYEDSCKQGVMIDYIRDTATNLKHSNYGIVGASAALSWIEARFERKAPDEKCFKQTTNTPNINKSFLALFPKEIQDSLLQLVGAP
ncbi:hypothetical protein NLU13_7966 [Sarocladium strictum]|uniref:Uncharacterized protein n=1 Tax=Sarocladium strictum TaxID=5046 RepID=A0AA39GC64_SARSR|nr:hypothetical protein NLU13_7966 [Sarocladium strictum]